MKKNNTFKMVLAAFFAAVGVLLPMVFHQFGVAGPVFLPMHIPVLLCGLVCGWEYGAIVGMMVPLISSFTGMPPIYPTGIAMMCELATYGFVAGFMKERKNHFIALITAMICGRSIAGMAMAFMMGMAGKGYGLTLFISTSFIKALPGIVIQIILIPAIMIVLEKTHLLDKIDQK